MIGFFPVGGYAAENPAPVLTAIGISRSSHYNGNVRFISSEPGSYYYAVVADGAPVPSIVTSGAGTPCSVVWTFIDLNGKLNPGDMDVYIQVKDKEGNVSAPLKIDLVAAQVGSWYELTNYISNTTDNKTRTIELLNDIAADGSYCYSYLEMTKS